MTSLSRSWSRCSTLFRRQASRICSSLCQFYFNSSRLATLRFHDSSSLSLYLTWRRSSCKKIWTRFSRNWSRRGSAKLKVMRRDKMQSTTSLTTLMAWSSWFVASWIVSRMDLTSSSIWSCKKSHRPTARKTQAMKVWKTKKTSIRTSSSSLVPKLDFVWQRKTPSRHHWFSRRMITSFYRQLKLLHKCESKQLFSTVLQRKNSASLLSPRQRIGYSFKIMTLK